MRCRAVAAQKSRLDALFDKVNQLPDDTSLELKSHWAKYLCVLSSGFVETSVETIFTEYARNKGTPPEVIDFTRYRLRRAGNLRCEELLTLVGQFAKEWKVSLEHKLTPEMKAALNSINTNRNSIAHGKDVQLSYVQVRDYHKLVAIAIEELDDIVNCPGTLP